ncbi:MAG: M14 family metallopeptidase [Gammaproteobacteria bacterium]|nr:M14 family metallopeptidase [Gammaproteobacteria bacterium]
MYASAILDVFSQRYLDARNQFIGAAETSPIVAKLNGFQHPLKGPKGEKLCCDVAWLGDLQAKQVVILVSGLHGVEGGVGSAIQTDFINRYRRLPQDVCVIVVHALNPWGFASACRNDHEGIDINRNFVDFSASLPEFRAEDLWQKLASSELDIEVVAQDREQFDVLSEGQYSESKALYYGGQQPSWSRQCIEQLAGQLKPETRDSIIVIDIHSGLGPYGYGELISDHPMDSPARDIALNVFGATVTEPVLGTSSSGEKRGLHDYFWHALGDHVCFVTLEFGTFGYQEMLRVLLADQKLQQQVTDWQDDETLEVKHAMQDFFCPDEKQWQELVLFRGRQVIEMALASLTGSGNHVGE